MPVGIRVARFPFRWQGEALWRGGWALVLEPTRALVRERREELEQTASVLPGTLSTATRALADAGSFDSGDLAPGAYSVQELAPAGWDLASVLIDDPSGDSSTTVENEANNDFWVSLETNLEQQNHQFGQNHN